jgi:DNA replication protein DnaC
MNQTQETAMAIADKFAAMIDQAPEEPTKSAEEVAQEIEAERIRRRDVALYVALGVKTGWPSKYLDAVKTPPHGQEWLAAYEVAKERVLMNGIVVLYGARGGGKTRMAAELAAMVGSSRYRTAMRFFLEVRATFRKDSERSELDVIEDLSTSDLLILDEIQERGETPFEDRLLTHVIDARYAAMKPTILIANLKKANLAESLGASIVDRARENGKSIEFNWPSYREIKS